MKKLLLVWVVLATSWLVGSLLIDAFTGIWMTMTSQTLVTFVTVTAAQAAVLTSLPRVFRS